jgi:tetratricopeptide (TPR) repeat protein
VAYQHYLKGKFFHSRRGPGDTERAIKHYKQALEIDASMADAWVGLAGSMLIRAWNKDLPWEEFMASSKSMLDRALELDPNHAEAHIRLYRYYLYLLDTDTARQHFDLALQYGQNSALVLTIAASGASRDANFERAIELQRRAVTLDPLGFSNRKNLANHLFLAGRFDEAGVEFLNALELNPEAKDQINEKLIQVFVLQQKYEDARVLVQQLPDGLARDQGIAMIYHVLDQEAQSNSAIERLRASSGVKPAALLAEIYALRGDQEESFKWLASASDRIYATKWNLWDRHYLTLMFTSPFLRPLHGDPRWDGWLADKETRTAESQM